MKQMLSGGVVLVVAEEMDPTADLGVDELARRELPVMRFDMGNCFPSMPD